MAFQIFQGNNVTFNILDILLLSLQGNTFNILDILLLSLGEYEHRAVYKRYNVVSHGPGSACLYRII